jgi:hypothetical protein
MPDKIYDVPARVSASRGKVREEKPDGGGADFTPEAALETAERLEKAAVEAKGEEAWRDK